MNGFNGALAAKHAVTASRAGPECVTTLSQHLMENIANHHAWRPESAFLLIVLVSNI